MCTHAVLLLIRRSSQVCYRLDCTHSCMIGGHRPGTTHRRRGAYRGSTCGTVQSLPGRSRYHSRGGTEPPLGNRQCWRSMHLGDRVVDLGCSDESHTLPCSTLLSSRTSCRGLHCSSTCDCCRRHRADSQGCTESKGEVAEREREREREREHEDQ